jgi:hypothetical protein
VPAYLVRGGAAHLLLHGLLLELALAVGEDHEDDDHDDDDDDDCEGDGDGDTDPNGAGICNQWFEFQGPVSLCSV